jgi:hypothetical protein
MKGIHMNNILVVLLVLVPFAVTIIIGASLDRLSRKRSPDQGEEIRNFFAKPN